MPFPAGVPTVTITKDYRDATGSVPAKISVKFTPSVRKVVTAQNLTIEPVPVVGTVTNGVLTAVVAATDGFTYRVDEQVNGIKRPSFSIAAPAATPAPTYKLDELAPIEPVIPAYVPVRTVEGVAPDAVGNIDLNLSGGGPHTHGQADITNLAADLALKAPLASPQFTGTPTGITKAHVGLGNVDNTSDASKPISTAVQAALDGKSNTGHSHGAANPLKVRQAYITSGTVNPLPNTAGAWAALSGFELTIPAVVGDYVDLAMNALRHIGGGMANVMLDGAVIVGSTIVRYLSTGSSTPPAEGDPGWYQATNFEARSDPRGFTVVSGDLDGANVRFIVAVKANNTGQLLASAAYPFYWRAINYGQVG